MNLGLLIFLEKKEKKKDTILNDDNLVVSYSRVLPYKKLKFHWKIFIYCS